MSGDQPPVGPGPGEEPLVPPAGGRPGEEPLVPPGPQPPDPATADGGGPGGGVVPASGAVEPVAGGAPVPLSGPGPYDAPAAPRMHWALVLVGIPVGFVAWVVGSIVVLGITSSSGPGSNAVSVAVLLVLLLAAVGLIVWRRTRRLAQGLVLGLAIGMVVAGGLCIPLVTSSGL